MLFTYTKCTYTHIYTSKCNLHSLHNVNLYVYDFRVDNLLLDNQLVCSSTMKTNSLTPGLPQLSIVSCSRLRPCKLFLHPLWQVYWHPPCSVPISAVTLVRLSVDSDITRTYNLTADSLTHLLLQALYPLCEMFPET